MPNGPERVLPHRSDQLEGFRRLAARYPELATGIGPLDHFPLVVDTNRVLKDVRWLAKRDNPAVRTALLELYDSGTVSLYAPQHLLEEVERHLPEFAVTFRLDRQRLEDAWRKYRDRIHFIPAAHLPSAREGQFARDPSDYPFIAAQEAVGAFGVISDDRDLPAMGALVVKLEALHAAVRFARSASAATGGRLIGGTALMSVLGLGYGAVKLATGGARAYGRLPTWMKVLLPLGIAAAAAFVVFHRPTRQRLTSWVDAMRPRLSEFKERAGGAIGQFCEELDEAETGARAAIEIVRRHIPAPERGPNVRQLAYRACLSARGPVALEEVVARAQREGYASRSKDPRSYVRRVLRADPRLRELDGGWDLTFRLKLDEGPVAAQAHAADRGA